MNISLAGRVVDGPLYDSETSRSVFVLASEISAIEPGPPRRVVSAERAWCEVVCSGDLAIEVAGSVKMDDVLTIDGVLRPVALDFEGDAVPVYVRIDASSIRGYLSARGAR